MTDLGMEKCDLRLTFLPLILRYFLLYCMNASSQYSSTDSLQYIRVYVRARAVKEIRIKLDFAWSTLNFTNIKTILNISSVTPLLIQNVLYIPA